MIQQLNVKYTSKHPFHISTVLLCLYIDGKFEIVKLKMAKVENRNVNFISFSFFRVLYSSLIIWHFTYTEFQAFNFTYQNIMHLDISIWWFPCLILWSILNDEKCELSREKYFIEGNKFYQDFLLSWFHNFYNKKFPSINFHIFLIPNFHVEPSTMMLS